MLQMMRISSLLESEQGRERKGGGGQAGWRPVLKAEDTLVQRLVVLILSLCWV